MGRVLPGMHQHDRHRVDPGVHRLGQSRTDGLDIQRLFDAAIGAKALRHLDNAVIELLRQHDLLGEDIGSCLSGDPQRIAKAPGDHEQGAIAFALQKGVGGDRGAHLHRADAARRHLHAGFQPKQPPDPLDRRVFIGLRVLRQQLQRRQAAIRRPADDVGEGPAPIDPEIPAPGSHAVPSTRTLRLGHDPTLLQGGSTGSTPCQHPVDILLTKYRQTVNVPFGSNRATQSASGTRPAQSASGTLFAK